jgi:hypothetical protein
VDPLGSAERFSFSGASGTTETVTPDEDEVRARLRIDAAPSGKKFQGVWLEVGDTRWVIDYRPTAYWRSFENEEVLVTGSHYQPFGQAINARHFRVATMRFAHAPSHAVPLRSIGPEQLLRGSFVEHVWPAGTRRAGDVERTFQTDDGGTYGLAAGSAEGDAGPVAISAREVEPDPSYAADTGGPKLFVIRVHPHDWQPERVR